MFYWFLKRSLLPKPVRNCYGRSWRMVLLHNVLVCCCSIGRSRHLRLIPILALDQEVTPIKVDEPKGSTLFTTGTIRQGSTMCMCVAMKRHVIVYEFNRTKQRHKKVKELTLPAPCSSLELFQERLCAGYTSGFGLFSIQGEGQHIQRKFIFGVCPRLLSEDTKLLLVLVENLSLSLLNCYW